MAYLGTSQGGVSRSPGTARIRKGGHLMVLPPDSFTRHHYTPKQVPHVLLLGYSIIADS